MTGKREAVRGTLALGNDPGGGGSRREGWPEITETNSLLLLLNQGVTSLKCRPGVMRKKGRG